MRDGSSWVEPVLSLSTFCQKKYTHHIDDLLVFKRSVGPDLDLNCLRINSLNISEEMLDTPQENCCCFHYIYIC